MSEAQIINYIITIGIFLVSLTIHEYAHARTAYFYGDDTAKRLGRLTLNPIAHISLVGTIIVPLIANFGWAKPVPVNFTILNKKQIFQVAAAGPLSNIILALILTGAFHTLQLSEKTMVGNYVLLGILVNLILATFNLLPIPPLDGSKMVYAGLKSPAAIKAYNQFAQYGFFILIGFLMLNGFRYIYPIIGFVYSLLKLPFPAF